MTDSEPQPDAVTPEDAATPEDVSPEGIAPDVLKRALKAFKKRLKLTRLDHESSLGVGPLSGGSSSQIVAITPPNQYPRAVWEALVEQERLNSAGQGQYELVKKQ